MNLTNANGPINEDYAGDISYYKTRSYRLGHRGTFRVLGGWDRAEISTNWAALLKARLTAEETGNATIVSGFYPKDCHGLADRQGPQASLYAGYGRGFDRSYCYWTATTPDAGGACFSFTAGGRLEKLIPVAYLNAEKGN